MNRRELLRQLINEKFSGNVAAFSRSIKKSPSQVHQWLSGHRTLGDAGAHHIERSVPGLWQGYFDGTPRPSWLDHNHKSTQTNTEPGPDIHSRVPLISWTTAGDWGDLVDNFAPGDAEDWVITTSKVGPHAFALRIIGDSMAPTIQDGALVIVDPDAQYRHRSVVIVRQNGDSEATCKRLVQEGSRWFLHPDNERYPIMEMSPDAKVVGVVRQVVMDLE